VLFGDLMVSSFTLADCFFSWLLISVLAPGSYYHGHLNIAATYI
jgi:hypothetical protein